jgi:hypothetical protein
MLAKSGLVAVFRRNASVSQRLRGSFWCWLDYFFKLTQTRLVSFLT